MTRFNIADCWRIAPLAKKLGIPRVTLTYAAKRGDIPSKTTACGIMLVREADVVDWMKRPQEHPGRGRSWGPKGEDDE